MDCLGDHGIVGIEDTRPPAPLRRGRWVVVGVSILAHVGVVVGLCVLASPRKLPPAPVQSSFEVVFAAAPADTPVSQETLAAAVLPAPAPVEQAVALAPLARLTVPAARAGAAPLRRVAHITVPLAPPHTTPVSVVAVPATPVPAPPAPSADRFGAALAAFEARVHSAVQLAARYPQAARLQRREGRAQIRFDYRDGAVSGPVVAQSSQSGLLDVAAVEAVQHAALPRPPAEIGSAKLSLLVWVDFRLVVEE